MNVSTLIDGILIGGVSALIAMGLSLIFGVLKMINLAHGEFVVGAAYLMFAATQILGIPLAVAVPLALVLSAVVGYVVQRGLLTALLRRGAEGPFVATFGLSLVLQAVLLQAFSSDPRSLATDLATASLEVFGLRVRAIYLIAFLLAAVLTAVIYLVLNRTRVGSIVKASAVDPTTAETQGINVAHVFALVMAASATLAALAGTLIGVAYSFTPTSGAAWLMVGMVVVVLGGVGNILGTFVASIGLGVIQALTAAVLGGGFRDMVLYLLFLTVLALRPQGIFASKVS